MIPGRALVVAGIVFLATPAFGQYASEIARREALQHYRARLEFLSSEQFEKAADAFRKAIEKDRLLALAHYGLGQSYMALKRYASAVVEYRNCRDTYEELVGRALSEGVTAERQREDEIRDLRDSIRLFQSNTVKTASPDRTQYIVKFEARLRELERMKQTNIVPQRPPAFVFLALGSAYFRQGQLGDAEREWKMALEIDPHFGEVHNNLAVVYMMTRREREAEEAVRAAERAGFRVHPQLKDDIRRMATP